MLAIDQGTTGTKVLLVDENANIESMAYEKHTQFYPKSGWVEHDPTEIWEKVKACVQAVLKEANVSPGQIKSIGIANQGETVMAWDKQTGMPIGKAIVWSCNRSSAIAEDWGNDGDWNQKVKQKTGLMIDSYFSATKIKWLMENSQSTKEAISQERILFGTMDSWLIWKITSGASHKTDPSTASRTLMYNIETNQWDDEILAYLDIKEEWLPEVTATVSDFGMSNPASFIGIEAPIKVSLVDQPASLFGHLCVNKGESKCTYGTGCFTYINVGNERPKTNDGNTLTSIVWEKDGQKTFALDGAVYSAGSSINWSIDSVKLSENLDELKGWSAEWLEHITELDHDLLFVPSLGGLASPYWNSEAKGIWLGFSYSTTNKELTRAVLEGIAHRVADTIEMLSSESNTDITSLRVDGGLTSNDYLMQFQANILGIPVEVTKVKDTTAMGVAYLLGEDLKWWDTEELSKSLTVYKVFQPNIDKNTQQQLRKNWTKAIKLLNEYYAN